MTIRRMRSAVGRGRADARPQPTALLLPRSNGKTRGSTAVVELLMMGVKMPKTRSAVHKRQVINLKNCCI
jgi:hypothetical protein